MVAGKEDPRFMSTTIYVSILAPISEEVSWPVRPSVGRFGPQLVSEAY